MKNILFTFFVVSALAGAVFAQKITDEDRRGFDEVAPINIDVDGDGKIDIITPRVYQVKIKKGSQDARDTQNWIAFDLATSGGKMVKSFFKYKYGTAEQGGSYWVYALKAAGDLDGDGKTDLVFYSGDDTSDEIVWLANKGSYFTELRRKISDNSDW